MLSYPPGTFVPIVIATHGLLGLTLGAALFDRPVAGLVAGLAPDADFLLPAALEWPFVHRGITHTLVFFAGVALAVTVVTDRDTGWAVITAYGSHLLVDVTTPKGIPYLYPLLAERIHHDVGINGHAPIVTVLFWVACLGVLAFYLDGRGRLQRPEWG